MVPVIASLLATVVSGVFSVALIRRWAVRGRSNRALLSWGISLGMFFVASAMLLLGVSAGWSSASFRTFYLFGAVLNVPWLAMGSVQINAGNRTASRVTGAVVLVVGLLFLPAALSGAEPGIAIPGATLGIAWGLILLLPDGDAVIAATTLVIALFSLVAVLAVLSAELRAPVPSGGLPEGRDLFPVAVRGFAVGANAVGAVIVVVSALVSSSVLAWRSGGERAQAPFRTGWRRAPIEALAELIFAASDQVRARALGHIIAGNLLIALGVLVAAAGGAFSFLGDTTGNAVGLALGVSIMYRGFVRTTRPVAGAG